MEEGGEVTYCVRRIGDRMVVYLEQSSERFSLSKEECEQTIEKLKAAIKEAWPE
jgi:hypothetical protein